ncbi:MAG: RrF2 family transcriptional regulator [Betaproteobacteria bacterium]
MRVTVFTDYALRVLIYLGTHQREARLATIGEIAAAYGISENHLMKIVHHLARQGYVETVRGKGGGMRLARAPKGIRIGEVVRGAEKDLKVAKCRPQGNECPIASICALSGLLGRAMEAFLEVLDRETLAELLKPRARRRRALRPAPRTR